MSAGAKDKPWSAAEILDAMRSSKAGLGARPQAARPPDYPPSSAGAVTVAILTAALGGEDLDAGATFAELGGDSLAATQVLARVWQALDVRLPLSSLAPDTEIDSFIARVERSFAHDEDAEFAEAPLRRLSSSEPRPLTPGQAAIWLSTELAEAEGRAVSTIPLALRLKGRLAVASLRDALDALVRRHDALALEVAPAGEALLQRRRSVGLHDLPVADGRGVDWMRLAGDHVRGPLDPAKPPLLRPLLIRIGDDDHLLAIAVHHIACDAWSVKILFRELAALYEAAVCGNPAELPGDLPGFLDFGRWQRDRLALHQEDLVSHWRTVLSSLPPDGWMPTDLPRPARRSGRGAAESFEIEPVLLSDLRIFSGEQGVTPFMTVFAAFALVLADFADQSDLVIGSPMANRSYPALAETVGYISNTLPIRVDLAGGPTVRQLLQRVRVACLDAYDHQELPLPHLLGAVAPRRDLAVPPLFQVCLVLNEMPAVPLYGLETEEVVLHNGASPYDLTLYLEQRRDRWVGYVEYPLDLFLPSTARRVHRNLRQALAMMVDAPDLPALSLLEQHGDDL